MSDASEPVVIISDLHLRSVGDWREQLEAITGIWRDAKTVVFNGDTMNNSLAINADRRREVLKMIHDLCARDGVKPIFISGNSDHMLPGPRHMFLADNRVLVLHGEVIFPKMSPWRDDANQVWAAFNEELAQMDETQSCSLERVLTAARQALRRCHSGSHPSRMKADLLQRWLCWGRWLGKPRRIMAVLNTWRRMIPLAEEFCKIHAPQTRVLIFGHAHRRGIWRMGDRTIINTGSFEGPTNPLMAVVHGSVVTVRKASRRWGNYTPGKVVAEISLD